MIKTVGLGRKCAGKTREQAQQYHINNHAPFGRRVAGPIGMVRYIGYYPQHAFDIAGEPMEIPWDFIVPEWFTDDFFNNIETWRSQDADGIAITIDEAEFCDRGDGVMMVCDDNIIIPDSGDPGVNLIFGAKRKKGLSVEECHELHRHMIGPRAAEVYGDALLDYTAWYIHKGYNLEEGVMDEAPFDIVIQSRMREEFWGGMEGWLNTPEAGELLELERQFIDHDTCVSMVCSRHQYLP